VILLAGIISQTNRNLKIAMHVQIRVRFIKMASRFN